jgi:hypothetical protein
VDMVALHKKYRYEGGVLYHKHDSTRVKLGDKVGTLHHSGYLQTTLNGKIVFNHRIIYAMHYGSCPKMLDHIDGNRLNNRIENLRPATYSQNLCNKGMQSNNTSGYRGVSECSKTGKWRVEVWLNKKYRYFGLYRDIELADLVACMAREKLHGQYARNY